MKIDKQAFAVVSVFLVLVLLFFFRFLSGDQIIGFKDLTRYFYPLRHLMVEQVRVGSFPLWNPYIFCGYPLLATLQICFFYPLSAIYYLLPFNLAFNYYIILHYFLAAVFMYWMLRHFELNRFSSLFGGIVFAFSGYLLSVSNMNTSLSSVVWLPVILLIFDRIMRGRKLKDVVFLGIFLALQFLGGEPTVIYVTLWFLIAYAAVFSGGWKAFSRNIGGMILSGMIALGLVAVQLFPFLELVKHSDRILRGAYEMATIRSFPPREIITFVFPYFFGNPAQFGGYTATLLGKTIQDWLISPYLGILPLIFVFLSFRRDRKLSLFLAMAAAVSLVLSFGKYTPFYRLAYLFPGVSLIRYPVKYLFMTTFCLVVLAAHGFDWLYSALDESKDKILPFFKVVFALSVVLGLIFMLIYFCRLQIFLFLSQKYSSALPKYFFNLLASIIEFNLLSLLFIIFYLFAFSLLLYMAFRGKIKRSIFALLVTALVTADLFSNGSSIIVPVRREVFEKVPKNIEILLKEKGIYRFFYTPELEQENRSTFGEDYSSALLESKDNLAANWHIPYHLFDFLGYESIKPAWLYYSYEPYFKKEGIKDNFRYLSLFNVKYIAAAEELDVPYLKLLRHKSKYGRTLYLYENPRALPRAYIVDAECEPAPSLGRSSILKYSPAEIIVTAELLKEGALFISEPFYPGWRVYVDGKRALSFRARNFFRKVNLTSGRHRVRFVYAPFSFRAGGYISLATILGLMLGGIAYFRKNK